MLVRYKQFTAALIVLGTVALASGCICNQESGDEKTGYIYQVEELTEVDEVVEESEEIIIEISDPEPVDLELIAGPVPDEYSSDEAIDETYQEVEEVYPSDFEYDDTDYAESEYDDSSTIVLEVVETYDEPEYNEPEPEPESTLYDSYSEYIPHDLMYHGVIYWGGWRWTWYSENVLPGPGLKIPGRWSDGNFVRDENGYICLASDDLDWGTYVDTPWGPGRVYDCGCASGTIDVYVSW